MVGCKCWGEGAGTIESARIKANRREVRFLQGMPLIWEKAHAENRERLAAKGKAMINGRWDL